MAGSRVPVSLLPPDLLEKRPLPPVTVPACRADHHPCMVEMLNAFVPRLSVTKRLLLLALPVAFFASWWATAHWGMAAVERHVQDRWIFYKPGSRIPYMEHYPPPEAFVRLTEMQYLTGKGGPSDERTPVYFLKTYSPFPGVILCESMLRAWPGGGRKSDDVAFWFHRWLWYSEDGWVTP